MYISVSTLCCRVDQVTGILHTKEKHTHTHTLTLAHHSAGIWELTGEMCLFSGRFMRI